MIHDLSAPFVGDKYQCELCEDIIWSRYPGHFCECKCGESYVDQTREFTRSTVTAKKVQDS